MNGNKKNETRQLPPLPNKGLVGGSGGLAFIGGIAGGVAKGAFNLISKILKGKSSSTKTTGVIKNAITKNRQAFTPAEREGARNLLKKL